MDFPTREFENVENYKHVNTKAVGAEVGESIKQSIKAQYPELDLLSSSDHTSQGGLRYLHEYLTGRKMVIDASANPKWIELADQVKTGLKGTKFTKDDTKALLNNNFELFPRGIRFMYSTVPMVFGTAALMESKKNNKEEQ